MGSSSMAVAGVRLSLLLLSILLTGPALSSQRSGRTEEDIRQTRRRLMAVRDPRRGGLAGEGGERAGGAGSEGEGGGEVSHNTAQVGRASRRGHSFAAGNRIQPIGRTRFRKRISKGRLRPGVVVQSDDKFVPTLLSVMNISYMNADSFRGPTRGRIEKSKQIASPVEPPQIKSNSSPASTLLTDMMNLSYMNSEMSRKTINKIRRRRIRVNPLQNSKSSIGINNNHHNHQTTIMRRTEKQELVDHNNTHLTTDNNMSWLWPPNTMDFSRLNFDLFDSQFAPQTQSRSRQRGLSNILVPTSGRVSPVSHQVDMNTGRFTLTVRVEALLFMGMIINMR